MNERQNTDETWSEAEPIKASWEDNKLYCFIRAITAKFKKLTQFDLYRKE